MRFLICVTGRVKKKFKSITQIEPLKWIDHLDDYSSKYKQKKMLELLNNVIYKGLVVNSSGILPKFATVLWVALGGHTAVCVEVISGLPQWLCPFALILYGCTLESLGNPEASDAAFTDLR